MDEIEDQLSGGKPGHQITDGLIRALKEVESSGNPKAVNPDSGATGAFQFMPSTVKMLKKQGIDFNPFDEKESERAARTYLQILRDKNGGDLNKALAQYGGHITKDPTNYINKIYARMEKNAAAPKSKAQPGDEIEQALLGKIEREPEPPAPPPLKITQLSQFGSQGVPEGDLVRQAMKKYFAPKPAQTAPAAAPAQVPVTTVAPQPTAQPTEFKVGSMADLGKGIVSLADVAAGGLTGLVGLGSYQIQRAMGVPEPEARKSVKEFEEKRAEPFGRALGISEDPAYKAEITRRLTNFVGENVGKGAAWISEKTGIPLGDVENMIGTIGLLPAPGVAKVGQKVGAATYGAEQALRDQFAAKPAALRVEPGIGPKPPELAPTAEGDLRAGFEARQTQRRGEKQAAVAKEQALTELANAPTQRELQAAKAKQAQAAVAPAAGIAAPPGSVGAAAVTDASAIDAALAQASPQLQAKLRKIPRNQINLPALESHLQAERLGLGSDFFTEGQATGNPSALSFELNERGKHPQLAERFNQQDAKLKEAVDRLHDRATQNEVSGTMHAHGARQIEQYEILDDAVKADIRQKYKALEDAAGGKFPIDPAQFVQNARELLETKYKTEYLPKEIQERLDKIASSGSMTFKNFEVLRTDLAAEMRKAARASDGNREYALSIVRGALEDLPLTPEAQRLKALADPARAAAKARFDALEADPAYKAAINGEPPDTFMDKYVFSAKAPADKVALMRKTFGEGSIGALNIESALINHLREKGGLVEKSNVNQATYNKNFKALEEKLKAGAKPETVEDLRVLGDVLYKTKARPTGSFVNESNTYVSQIAGQGAGAAAKAGDVFFTAKTGLPIPVVSGAVEKVKSSFEAKKMKRRLESGAGVQKRD